MSMPVPILMYHSVSDTAGSRFRKYAISPDNFARQMEFLRGSGYSTITVSQFAEAIITSAVSLPKRPVVVTFDDGYADFYLREIGRAHV